jgi:signal transduction histidine kinase
MNADIDQMTSMIASVLAYTQSEVNLETPRLVSLVSMVQSIVDDFTDDNKPVQFTGYETPQIVAQTILFNRPKASGGKKANQQQHEVVIHARPLALQRALINIIENALKYGRKASVSIEATSQTAKIHVDDYGDSVDIDALRALTAPFKRGDNAENVQGFGIGLAIAVTVLEQHGGTIEFNVWSEGTRVTLTLPR